MLIYKCGRCAALNAYDGVSLIIKTCYTCGGAELTVVSDELPF
jgi:predicted  nucleic acid-binding Zn-ribbon protein